MIAQSKDIGVREAFLEYEGVKVYRTYQFDDPCNYPPSSHLFTTAPEGTYDHDPFRFDIRNLTVPTASAEEDGLRAGAESTVAAVLQEAIDRGMIATPGNGTGFRSVQVCYQAW